MSIFVWIFPNSNITIYTIMLEILNTNKIIIVFVVLLYFLIDTINYPLLSLAEAYDCECHTSYAHNKCLLTINKCPTCRKKSKPNLYVRTRYDYYLKFLLRWLKKDKSKILTDYNYMLIFLINLGSCIIYYNCNNAIKIFIIVSIYILNNFYDYLKKYWLYNSKTNKYDVFNNKSIINISACKVVIIYEHFYSLIYVINKICEFGYVLFGIYLFGIYLFGSYLFGTILFIIFLFINKDSIIKNINKVSEEEMIAYLDV